MAYDFFLLYYILEFVYYFILLMTMNTYIICTVANLTINTPGLGSIYTDY